MTCLEAQSNIMAFIDKKLPDDRVTDFVRHVKHCPNCSEELEIYYTLIVGMRKLDNNQDISLNFKKDLDDTLDRLDNKVKNTKRAKVSLISIICVAAVVLLFFVYNGYLSKVYDIEQQIIKERQGKYYFYDNFNDYLEICDRDIIKESYKVEETVEETFYDKIKLYNLVHSHYNDEDDVELQQ